MVVEDDPTNPTRKLVRSILGAVSEYEKSLVVLKLRMKSLRASGMGFGRELAEIRF